MTIKCQFHWWSKLEYQEETIDLWLVTDETFTHSQWRIQDFWMGGGVPVWIGGARSDGTAVCGRKFKKNGMATSEIWVSFQAFCH